MLGSDAEVLAELRGRVSVTVIDDPDILGTYSRDQAAVIPAGRPLAAVLPTTTDEVCAVVETAGRYGRPIVPRGAGSGLSGGANAVDGCLVVSLERMNRVLEVNSQDLYAVVEPGVINADLRAAAAAEGLLYPPDPASYEFSTIGGNVATNAGGLCCVKYGVTRDYVLGLEVVLAGGEVARLGRRTVKGVAGYDLTGLFVGSEGTLGIITQATLRLVPARERPLTVAAFFPELKAAGRAVAEITAAGIGPSVVELLDQTTINAIEDWKRMGLDRDAAALLLIQSDLGGEAAKEEVRAVVSRCESAGASFVAHAGDPEESDELMAARRFAFPALDRQGEALLDDVAVPRSQIPALLAAIEKIAGRHDVVIGTFGHAGEGNVHPTIVYPRNDRASEASALAAFADIVLTALELGGTITGEHGVGLLKRDLLQAELDDASRWLHRTIRSALDPSGLFNPDKVV
jgi:glycolate oxidase